MTRRDTGAPDPAGRGIPGRRLPNQAIHVSYHKNLTVFFDATMRLVRKATLGRVRHKHFNSEAERFLREHGAYTIASLNNHPPLDSLDYTGPVTQFVRDPRDLVVSGYFYHLRGAEAWTRIVDPAPGDFAVVNGTIPPEMPAGLSFSGYLQTLSVEDGLLAELAFRRHHFDAMRAWARCGWPNLLTLHYEEIVRDYGRAMARVLAHHGFGPGVQAIGRAAARYRGSPAGRRSPHVRNPAPSQWHRTFTPKVADAFAARHEDLPALLGYPPTAST
ncbi:hypothetical protein SAMN05216241_101122 [Limimonas halophila]|uniref:Sulfotransferase domain-containing protein n=1 Tax=Limimonas halophila TaxID=1082479 RepID=A0A1G7L6B4_9PROT|nr:hypothetical protein [Limimonas halophila]SDF44610.1 hypothetical protein SAMN05216241_101122 [Limimonas halophila]